MFFVPTSDRCCEICTCHCCSVSFPKEDWNMQRASWFDRRSSTPTLERSLHLTFSSSWRFSAFSVKTFFYHLPPPPPYPLPPHWRITVVQGILRGPIQYIFAAKRQKWWGRQSQAITKDVQKKQKTGSNGVKEALPFPHRGRRYRQEKSTKVAEVLVCLAEQTGRRYGKRGTFFPSPVWPFCKRQYKWKKTNRQLVFFFLSNAIMQLNLSVNLVLCLLFSFTSCDIRVKAENYLKINKKVNKNTFL